MWQKTLGKYSNIRNSILVRERRGAFSQIKMFDLFKHFCLRDFSKSFGKLKIKRILKIFVL